MLTSKSIIHNSFWSLLETLSITGGVIITTPLIINIFGVDIFSYYTLLISFVGFFSIISTSYGVVIESQSLRPAKKQNIQTLRSCFSTLLLVALAIALANYVCVHSLLVSNLIFPDQLEDKTAILRLLPLFSILSLLDQIDIFLASTSRTIGLIKASAKLDVLTRSFQIIASTTVALTLKNFSAFLVTILLCTALRIVLRNLFLSHSLNTVFSPSINVNISKTINRAWVLNLWSVATSAFYPLLEKILLSALMTPSMFSAYLISLQAASTCPLFCNGLLKWILPDLSNIHSKSSVLSLRTTTKRIVILNIASSVLGLAAAIASATYLLSVTGNLGTQASIFCFLSIAAAFLTSLSTAAHYLLLAMNRFAINSIFTTLAAVSSLFFLVLMRSYIGIWSAFLSRLIYAIIVAGQNLFAFSDAGYPEKT